MKRSYLFTAYIVEFQVLNGMRIGELLAIQPDNIDFENKKLVIDGTIHWRKDKQSRFQRYHKSIVILSYYIFNY